MRAKVHKCATPCRIALLATLSVILIGCETLGPNMVRSGRNDYNEAINNTELEQLLLNIVRLRHTDTAYFLQIATVTSRTEVGAAVGSQSGNPLATLKYSENPSIVYVPLTGESFVRQLLTRVDLNSLSLLAGAGWEMDDILRVFVDSINGVGNAVIGRGPTPEGVPTYEKFHEVADVIDALEDGGDLALYSSEDDPRIGVLTILGDGRFSPVHQRLATLLNIDPSLTSYQVRLGVTAQRSDTIFIESRPIVSAMYSVGHNTQIPDEVLDGGLVHINRDENGERIDWSPVNKNLFAILSSRKEPKNAFVATRYRGYWYYIDAADINSRETLTLLNAVFLLMAGGESGGGPVLTLPVD